MYILFDIGGTKTRVAVSEDLHSFTQPIKYETPKDFESALKEFSRAVGELSQDKEIFGVAGGIRGPLNHEKTSIISEEVLIDWVGRPITQRLSAVCDAPIYLENDAAIAGLGEAVFGAGKGYSVVAYHTVSTGVGGVKIVDGHIDTSSIGFEPGHQELDIDRSILGHSVKHTLQNLISGSALEKRRGVKPYEIAQDDPVWNELAGFLAHGLKNTIVYWSPNVIVLGGSMIVGDPRILLDDIIRHTKEVLGDLMPCPPIRDAALGDNGGLYGAMALLQQKTK